ncbi:TPA: AraC family transcriptional regulator [Klebsiella pneumoniae]
MKIVREKIHAMGNSFIAYHYDNTHFDHAYHFHKEYEIVLVTHSCGKVISGITQVPYHTGDVFIFGSNIPHEFITDSHCLRATSSVVQFSPHCLGESFFSLPETKTLQNLFNRSQYGIKIADTPPKLRQSIEKVISKQGVDKVVSLITLLQYLNDYAHIQFISQQSLYRIKIKDEHKINAVLNWLDDNYAQQDICLDEMASFIHMSKQAFCRCFKKNTGQTFIEHLTRLRINKAMELLNMDERSITDIALDVGFSNISNFNRTFKALQKTTPSEYRRQMQK